MVSYSPDASSVPDLNLLASMFADINKGPKFLDASLAQTLNNVCPKCIKVVFGKLLLVSHMCKKFQHNAHLWWRDIYDDGNIVFRTKIFVMQNLGVWGLISTVVKFVVECAIFGIADPDLLIHYATFMGLQWWL